MDVENLGLTPAERRLAEALDGSDEALEALARRDDGGDLARRHRAGPALALRTVARALTTPTSWHRDLLAAAMRHLQARATVEEAGERLAAAGVEWVPFKGYDMATRFYAAAEERPATDVDLLILPARLAAAREALAADGWQPLFTGRRYEDFLAEESYAWLARKADRTLIEVHYRLWGMAPEGLAEALFERSRPDPGLPPGGGRLRPADAYFVAAVHTWLTPPPRPLTSWWDLAQVSAGLTAQEVDDVVDAAREWDLALPVALAAEISADLWRRDGCRAIASRLAASLRPVERRVASRARRRGLTGLTLARLQAARLLSGRRSRQGWLTVWRRVWAHPGVVERSTPAEWPWIRRRLVSLGRSLGPG